jgi:hypothetical protein
VPSADVREHRAQPLTSLTDWIGHGRLRDLRDERGRDRLAQLTDNSMFDGTPTFSPNGQQLVFHRTVGGAGGGSQQLFIMNSSLNADGTLPTRTQLTFGTPTSGEGVNNLAHWGELRVHVTS